jgi:hypothetical protein
MSDSNYRTFKKRLHALDVSVVEFAMLFNRRPTTWRKNNKAPEWAWDVLVSLEEFPGLLAYYRHLMALRKERNENRVKQPQPPWLVGKQGGFLKARRAAASLESTAVDGDQPTDNLPVAGEP